MAKKNQTPQTPDEMEVMLNKSEAFVTKYGKQLIAAVVLLVALVLGYVAYTNYSASSQEEASTALASCQQLFSEGKYTEALNGDKKACKGFLHVAKEYSSTDAGNLANLYAGLCYANLEKWNEAKSTLEEFSPKGDKMVSPAALKALADAYANTNEIDKAIDTYKKAAAKADAGAKTGINLSLSPTCLQLAAFHLEKQNKADEALDIYKEIKTKYVGSQAAQQIDKYIERASQK